ncbi:hypothetical protein NDU88_006480 [Pleurodeles waltl]|uniref:Uncharacterized protein n=1 Tax=Pleurodeles waltl TaxID=8319 RepID=A0AAV7PIV2_PLEWA|nr:hypothetical protein NDU88_006480 [Pleurodeles waltl]
MPQRIPKCSLVVESARASAVYKHSEPGRPVSSWIVVNGCGLVINLGLGAQLWLGDVTLTLASHGAMLPPTIMVLITCVHGDQRYYPLATIRLKWRDRTEPLRVGVLPRLDEDIILGTDYEDFPSLLDKAGQEHLLRTWWEESPSGLDKEEPKEARVILSRRQKREQRHYYAQKSLPRDGPEVARKVCMVTGDFRRNQNENPSLKHAWQQALSP